ncbi:hypothetical protein FHP91_21025 [Denitromonas halophila]|uniref:Uncharacterized protein n=1 Tax=Denitromonas halophila TaxID=1629404 RepID=A0A557QC33_9RHOO|nr:hypothetical protein FHP91_21025 [Denitromonas halophila]
MSSPILRLHEDAFYAFFRPYRHPEARHDIWGGIGLETFGADWELVRGSDIDHVWTVVDGDSGSDQWITPGIRYVNRVCYLLTERSNMGVEVEFRCQGRPHTLTPIGLARQIRRLERALLGVGRRA